VWARIEGGTGPPLSPQVWLQGDSGAWKPRDPHLGDLWDALRIAVLAAAWRLRCRRAAWDSQFTPTDVAKAAIADLRTIARANWARATSPGGLRLDGISPRVLNRCRGAAGRATIADFELKWCGGGVVAYVAHRRGHRPAMEFRLRPPTFFFFPLGVFTL
jgi:hypothetical protein